MVCTRQSGTRVKEFLDPDNQLVDEEVIQQQGHLKITDIPFDNEGIIEYLPPWILM
jgi:hypothetical protein